MKNILVILVFFSSVFLSGGLLAQYQLSFDGLEGGNTVSAQKINMKFHNNASIAGSLRGAAPEATYLFTLRNPQNISALAKAVLTQRVVNNVEINMNGQQRIVLRNVLVKSLKEQMTSAGSEVTIELGSQKIEFGGQQQFRWDFVSQRSY